MIQATTIMGSLGVLVGAEVTLFGLASVMTRSVARGVADGLTMFGSCPQAGPSPSDWALGMVLSGGLLTLGSVALLVLRACRGSSHGSL